MYSISRLALLVFTVSVVLTAAPVVAAGSTEAGDVVAASDTVGPAQTGNETSNETTPQLDLALNGEAVSAGSFEVVSADPSLTVDASVGPDAGADTTIQNLILRVGGVTERSYSPDTAETSVSVTLPLDRGNNTVTVIVEDSEDRLESREFTVGKDDIAPWIGLTSPYQSDLRATIQNGTATGTDVDVGVRFGDFSAIEETTIDVEYDGKGDSVTIRDPGKRVSREMHFGYGNNTVRITATDALGNTRFQEFTIEAVDDAPPDVSLGLYPDGTTESSVTLTGTIEDDVWVKNASLFIEYVDASNTTGLTNFSQEIRPNTEYEYNGDGKSITFEEHVNLRHGNNRIHISAGDHLENVTTRTIEIERIRSRDRGSNEPPSIDVFENRTRLRDDGRVQLHARISDPDWNLDAVSIETANASSGKLLDFERFDLGGRESITLNETLSGDAERVRLRVRATDENGERDTKTLWLTPTDDQPATTTTPTPTETNETATTSTTTDTTTTAVTETTTQNASSMMTTAGNETGNESANASESRLSGLPVIGSLPIGAVIGVLSTVAPFVVGGLVFLTGAYFVLRRVKG